MIYGECDPSDDYGRQVVVIGAVVVAVFVALVASAVAWVWIVRAL